MSQSQGRYKSFLPVGAPGCGKGTQGAILGSIPRFYHFSMGDAFRSIDGIPRSVEQAKLLEEHIDVLQLFHFACPDRDELITRIRKRAIKSGRLDDASEDVIRRRINTYEEETMELFDFYSHCRSDIDADQVPVRVLGDILEVILEHPEWQDFVREV